MLLKDIATTILDCGILDIGALEDYMNVFNLDFDEVYERAKEFSENPKFNELMYTTLSIGESLIKEKLIEFFPQYKEQIEDYEFKKYVNYMDSGYDEDFSVYDYERLKEGDEETAKEILKAILPEIDLDTKEEQDE